MRTMSNGETTEEDIGNVESDDKEQESGHFVDMFGTEVKDETETDGSLSTAEYVDNIRPRHFRTKPLRRSVEGAGPATTASFVMTVP